MEMKKMPYKIEEGAIEHAKYLAKMAVREAAHPTEHHTHQVQWRWAGAIAAVAVVVVGVVGFVKYYGDSWRYDSPMEELIAEMKSASDDIIYDLSVDSGYYLEEENQL